MTFKTNKLSHNIPELMRHLGYRPLGYTGKGELNCVRPLGAAYPRFHIYLKEEGEVLVMNIHLDQKKPSYGDETMHSGDYESETVKQEVERIKEIIFRD